MTKIWPVLIVGLLVTPLFGQSRVPSAVPSLEPDRRALEWNRLARSGTYTWEDLADIALWASDLREQTGSKERIIQAVQELLTGAPADSRERGEYVLTVMHRRYLKNYAAHQTLLNTLLTTGRYNCVSSAVYYAILAVATGLEVRGVMTRDHAFVTLQVGDEFIDVETTNPYGFDPGSRREFQNAFGKTTGFAYVPPRNYRDRVTINPLELVSLILSNRIAEAEARGQYAEALTLAVNREALLSGRKDPVSSPFFRDPRMDLMDRIFNYTASLIQSGRERDALAWAALAEEQYPDDRRWGEFTHAALNNLVVKLLRANQLAEARTVLGENARRLPGDQYRALETQILDAELLARIGKVKTPQEAEQLLADLETVQGAGSLPGNRAEELRTFILLKEGERAAAGGTAGGIRYLERAIARYGRNVRLEETLRLYRTNRIAELHNRFAGLFNRKDYQGARRFIQEALIEFPDSRQLQSDLNALDRILGGR